MMLEAFIFVVFIYNVNSWMLTVNDELLQSILATIYDIL